VAVNSVKINVIVMNQHKLEEAEINVTVETAVKIYRKKFLAVFPLRPGDFQKNHFLYM
jgi:hypothetical protein